MMNKIIVLLLITAIVAKEEPKKNDMLKGKREAPLTSHYPSSNHIHQGYADFAPSGHGHSGIGNIQHGYNYNIPQPAFHVQSHHSSHKLPSFNYLAPQIKYNAPQAIYYPHEAKYSYPQNNFAGHKYNLGSKELGELLKQLNVHAYPAPIKHVPQHASYPTNFGVSHGWNAHGHQGSGLSYENSISYKPQHVSIPAPVKTHEIPSTSYGTPLAPPLNAYTYAPSMAYSAPQHSAISAGYEPSYAAGLKGLGHYSTHPTSSLSSYEIPSNKYVTANQPHSFGSHQSSVSNLHTSVYQSPKPFKPSTYLGTGNDITDYSNSHSYIQPALTYLPAKVQNKITYEAPSKSYIPVSSPSNAYLPSKPSHSYLPAASSNSYLPPSAPTSHDESGKHSSEHLGNSLDYSQPQTHWKH